jgi:predicted DCC family thiol-disulfide oxidoreductase YuxK
MEIVYDADCGLCQASIAWVERHDRDGNLVTTPSTSLSSDEAADLCLDRTVVVRSGEIDPLTRSRAVAAILAKLPKAWGAIGGIASTILRVSLLQSVGDALYDAVARRRIRISGFLASRGLIEATCGVPASDEVSLTTGDPRSPSS